MTNSHVRRSAVDKGQEALFSSWRFGMGRGLRLVRRSREVGMFVAVEDAVDSVVRIATSALVGS